MMNLHWQSRLNFLPTDSPQQIFTKILNDRQLDLQPPFPNLDYLVSHWQISLSSLDKLTHILQSAFATHKKICIFGDYDVDGLTSTAILWHTLRHFTSHSMPFIPHRSRHGYGLSNQALNEIISGQAFSKPFIPDLIITTDTGITATQQVRWLKKHHLQVIVTDHHLPPPSLPPADVILHTPHTSAAGIAWLIAKKLLGEKASHFLIDLAALGVVADQIPLTGANRALVYHGLRQLNQTQHPGLKALIQSSSLTPPLTSYHLAFILAPRLNAPGRLTHALDGLRLLCTSSSTQAHRLATHLSTLNQKRQTLTRQSLNNLHRLNHPQSLVHIYLAPDAPEGIIGLLAGKMLEKTGYPTLVLTHVSPTLLKGSARSLTGLDITDFLRRLNSYLTSVGGHTLAAGFSLPKANLQDFLHHADILANQLTFSPKHSLSIDGQLRLSQTTKQLYQLLQSLAPFGLGNPQPLFLLQDFSIAATDLLNHQHKKFLLVQDGVSRQAIWWRADSFSPQQIVFSLHLNTWQNKETLQLHIRHAR